MCDGEPETASGYEFAEGIAIADVAFRAYGPHLEAVFEQAARATLAVMVDDLDRIAFTERRDVVLTANDAELLLFDFLQELIYYKDAEELLLLPESVEIDETAHGCELRARLGGEPIDRERHPLNADVKAVTMHRFALRRRPERAEATVVLDI